MHLAYSTTVDAVLAVIVVLDIYNSTSTLVPHILVVTICILEAIASS